jgi:CBS domain-containing membrane protein
VFQSLVARSASLLPQSAFGHLGWLRGALGAMVGIGVAALSTILLLGANSAGLPWLVAPLGASAVLVFAVPASPLAQPWSVIGGNLISATIGIALGLGFGSAALAASLAVGAAIAVMICARCLHPPGGACALLCALGASTQGWDFGHLWPIFANVLALSFVGWLYNNLTGHQWPHHVELPEPKGAPSPVNHTRRDIEEVLTDWNEVLDVDVDDLDAFYLALERHVAKRRARSP